MEINSSTLDYRAYTFPEPHFDIPIEEDWAKFEYEINGKKIKRAISN